MIGWKAGVGTLLKLKYHNIVLWHCLNHRLELAVSDAMKDSNCRNHFRTFLEKLHSVYSTSPKKIRALHESARELNEQMLTIGKIFSIRWEPVLLRPFLLSGNLIVPYTTISSGQHLVSVRCQTVRI